jgi:hypothetical protein
MSSKLSRLLKQSKAVSDTAVKTAPTYQPDNWYTVDFDYDFPLSTIEEWIEAYFKYILDETRIFEAQGRVNALVSRLQTTRKVIDQKALLAQISAEAEECDLQKHMDEYARFKKQSSLLMEQYRKLEPYQRNLEKERRYRLQRDEARKDIEQASSEEERHRAELKLCQIDVYYYTPTPEERLRVHLIMSYIELAMRYIKIKVTRKIRIYPECSICHHVMMPHSVTDEGYVVCVICGTREYKPGAKYDPIRSDNQVIEKSDEANIMKAFDRRACLQNIALPEDMEELLDEYLAEHSLPSSAELREMPLVKRYRGPVNHKLLWKALEAKGFNRYYKHSDLIGVKFWGWSQPQMEHLRKDFIAIYRKTQAAFNSIEDKTRKSSISTQLRLYHQLELLGHDCDIGEFKIPTGASGVAEQEELWRKMCEMANDPFIVYISLK